MGKVHRGEKRARGRLARLSASRNKKKEQRNLHFLSLIRTSETSSLRYSRSEILKYIWYFSHLFVPLQAESSAPVCRWWQHERKVRAAQDTPLAKVQAVGDGWIWEKRMTASSKR